MSLCGHSTLRVLFPLKSFCSTHVEAMSCWDVMAKSIWDSRVPTQACFFAWAASKAKIPTEDKLEEKEIVGHLLVHCRWVASLWYSSLFLTRG